MKKVPFIICEEAAALAKEGDTILGGGFGMMRNSKEEIFQLLWNGIRKN